MDVYNIQSAQQTHSCHVYLDSFTFSDIAFFVNFLTTLPSPTNTFFTYFAASLRFLTPRSIIMTCKCKLCARQCAPKTATHPAWMYSKHVQSTQGHGCIIGDKDDNYLFEVILCHYTASVVAVNASQSSGQECLWEEAIWKKLCWDIFKMNIIYFHNNYFSQTGIGTSMNFFTPSPSS